MSRSFIRAVPGLHCGLVPALALVLLAPPLAAQTTPVPDQAHIDQRKAELRAAWQEAARVAIAGPKQIALLDQATLNLPAGHVFVPAAAADRIMVALGNRHIAERVGLILPNGDNQQWLTDITWIKEGYVKDGDAKEWQPDALLDSLKQGAEEDNKRREANGGRALDITGWAEPPTYNATKHQLLWSVVARVRGLPADAPQNINYNTYALGREGYFSLDLITDSTAIAADKAEVRADLAGLGYQPGKRYEDFNGSTDKVAAYGLAGLIGVVAIKKLGLLAAAGLFLLKIWKLVLFTVLGGWAALRHRIARLFGRGKADPKITASDFVFEAPEPEPEPALPEPDRPT